MDVMCVVISWNYNDISGAPNVNILAPSGELTPEHKITVGGHVLDRNCNAISGAIVHAWHAGGASGKANKYLTRISWKLLAKCSFYLKSTL